MALMFFENWYQLSMDAVVKRLKTDSQKGLDRKTVKELLRKNGQNLLYPVSKVTFYHLLRSITMDYTSYLLLITSIIAAVFEETSDAWILVILVVLNLVASLLIYTKSQKILEGMDRYTLPVVRVIREGRLYLVDQKVLAQGDLICLSAGDIVPADARLVSSEGLVANEADLFGRGYDRQEKDPSAVYHETVLPNRQKNMVFASTIITEGEGTALVTATSEDTVVVYSGKNHPIISHERVPVLGAIRKISRVWSLVVIAAVFLLTILDFVVPGQESALFQSFMKGLSFAVSTMSEMYVAFGFIVLAGAVFQTIQSYREAGGSGVVIKNPLSMEKLRKLTCLVIPKEGVLTSRETETDYIFAGGHLFHLSNRHGRRAMERPILFSVLSTGLYGADYLREKGVHTNTSEEKAILSLARKMGIYNARLDRSYPMLDHRGVDEFSRYETTLVSHRNERMAIIRGEVASILSDCAYYYCDGKAMILTREVAQDILQSYRKLLRDAYSVVAIASKKSVYTNLNKAGMLQTVMVFEGFLAFRVPYQKGVGQLISEARRVGIKVIMTSEKTADEELYFAQQIGIVENRSQCVDGSELSRMKEGIRRTNVSYYRMYCSLNPSQREELLAHLHEDGEVVAVVGAKMEDLPYLRKADVSIARNIAVYSDSNRFSQSDTVYSKTSESGQEEGCEALKFASDILLSDSDAEGNGGFRSILEAIGIAKNTEKNVLRIFRYLLASQTARFLLIVFSILFSYSGMNAIQILFLGLVLDFMSVLVLSYAKPDPGILESDEDASRKLNGPLFKNSSSVFTGVCWAFGSILSVLICQLSGIVTTPQQCGTVMFLSNCIISLLLLYSTRRDEFVFRPGMRMSTLMLVYSLALIELLLLFALFPTFGWIFGVTSVSAVAWLVVILISFACLMASESLKLFSKFREETVAEQTERKKKRGLPPVFYRMRQTLRTESRPSSGPDETPEPYHSEETTVHDEETEPSSPALKQTLLERIRQKIEASSLWRERGEGASELPDNPESNPDEALPEELPDEKVFLQAGAENDLFGTGMTGPVTMEKTVSDLRSFLHQDTKTVSLEEEEKAADSEFTGIGYLFSDSEYSAVIDILNKEIEERIGQKSGANGKEAETAGDEKH
ncbi:MAG: cation-transporting P-type ATPase [Clostridia bacterium]|nr:cation-transporting P-type ATPase [Clostridia bacterium]